MAYKKKVVTSNPKSWKNSKVTKEHVKHYEAILKQRKQGGAMVEKADADLFYIDATQGVEPQASNRLTRRKQTLTKSELMLLGDNSLIPTVHKPNKVVASAENIVLAKIERELKAFNRKNKRKGYQPLISSDKSKGDQLETKKSKIVLDKHPVIEGWTKTENDESGNVVCEKLEEIRRLSSRIKAFGQHMMAIDESCVKATANVGRPRGRSVQPLDLPHPGLSYHPAQKDHKKALSLASHIAHAAEESILSLERQLGMTFDELLVNLNTNRGDKSIYETLEKLFGDSVTNEDNTEDSSAFGIFNDDRTTTVGDAEKDEGSGATKSTSSVKTLLDRLKEVAEKYDEEVTHTYGDGTIITYKRRLYCIDEDGMLVDKTHEERQQDIKARRVAVRQILSEGTLRHKDAVVKLHKIIKRESNLAAKSPGLKLKKDLAKHRIRYTPTSVVQSYENSLLDVQLPEELSGSLRRLIPAQTLVANRLHTMMLRGMAENSYVTAHLKELADEKNTKYRRVKIARKDWEDNEAIRKEKDAAERLTKKAKQLLAKKTIKKTPWFKPSLPQHSSN